jgi:hypothetical protein
MLSLFIPALFAAAAVPPKLSAAQAAQVRCVGALAIVANDQERGAETWEDVPRLASRGAHFAGTVGERLIKDAGMTREQVRDAMVKAVATFQKGGEEGLDEKTVTACIALMDKLNPAPPAPSLPDCAAMMALAYDDATRRKEVAGSVRDLALIAAVLDARAREELRGQGKTEVENDAIIGLARERIEADAKAGKQLPDTEQCVAFAQPPQRKQSGPGHQ